MNTISNEIIFKKREYRVEIWLYVNNQVEKISVFEKNRGIRMYHRNQVVFPLGGMPL